MIDIQTVVLIVFFLICCGVIFALLFYAVNYCEKEIGGEPLIYKCARIFLVLAAVFLLIGAILHLMGYPLIRMR